MKNNQMKVRQENNNEEDDDDDDDDGGGAITSMSSSQNDGLLFESNNEIRKQISNKTIENDDEDFQRKYSNENLSKYFYDGIEELFSNSENEDDERLVNDQHRISFTREQLLEYQQLIKLLRFIKNGGRCTTMLALSLLQDYHLDHQCAYLAFKDTSTIHVLLNFIEMFDENIKLNSLYVLKDACQNHLFAYELFHLGGILTFIDSICLDQIGIEESCQILLKILRFRRARRVIRRSGGISKLISLVDELTENVSENHEKIANLFEVFVLLCKSEKNKYVCIRYGIREILIKLIRKNLHSISILSLLCLLLQISIFREQITNHQLIINLINLIDLTNLDLTRLICECLYYLSINSNLSKIIYRNGWTKFEYLFEQSNDPSILSSISDILSEYLDENEIFSKKILSNLIRFIQNSSTDVLYFSRLIKTLNQLRKTSRIIQLFKQENLFTHLIDYLEKPLMNNIDIQLNILSILQQSAKDSQAAKMIVDQNGLQIFWTLYKLGSLPIQISSGWTIRNCLSLIENHGELIRSFDGIFYLLLKILSTDNLDLLSVNLSIIAEIVKDEYNLEILTDLGIVEKISQLNYLENNQISQSLCDAIANLLNLKKNQESFSNRRIFLTLKNRFQQNNKELLRPLTKAIHDLSLISTNSVLLHNIGLASNLLELIENDDSIVQEYSAKALRNMRRLFEANKQIQRNFTQQTSRQRSIRRQKRNKCL